MKIGDKVRLISGGPKMTIIKKKFSLFSGVFECAWFCDDGIILFREEFPEESLTLIL